MRGDKGVKMTAECYECATAGGHEGSEFLRGMMQIFADECVKYACDVAHHAKKKSEAIPAEREGRAGRSREKMNEQCVRMIPVSNLNQSLLSHSLSAFSSFLTEMPPGVCVVREHRMYCCGSGSAEEGRYDINTQMKGR